VSQPAPTKYLRDDYLRTDNDTSDRAEQERQARDLVERTWSLFSRPSVATADEEWR
jgi:hypothetical protein